MEENVQIMCEKLRKAVKTLTAEYPIKKVVLFGSRAAGTFREHSDVDLIVEFSESISLLTLSELRFRLEDMLGLDVDLIHGPLKGTDLLEIGREIEIYAA